MSWRAATVAVWAALAAAVLLIALAAHASTTGHVPRLGAVVARWNARGARRALLLLGWMWLGWHAFAR